MECFREKKLEGITSTRREVRNLKPNNVLRLKFNGGFNGAMTPKKIYNNPMNLFLKIQNLHTTQKKTQN
jgi:hypothetical protein